MTVRKKTALIAIALTASVLLTGCEPTADEVNSAKEVLPPGCVIREIGSYGGHYDVLVVICDGRPTTSAHYRSGKTSRDVLQIGAAA